MKNVREVVALVGLVLGGLLGVQSDAATPKAYLRGPSEEQVDKPIFLKFNGSVSDQPITIEQVTGPEEVALGYWFDSQGRPIYAVGTASVPGLYRFSVIAEGIPDGQEKPVRAYAFWDVNIVGKPVEPVVVPHPDEGVISPTGVIPLTVGKASPLMKLGKGQQLARFSFRTKAQKTFTIATSGDGAWRMELAGPDDPNDVIAVDNDHSGVNANAKITKLLPAGRTFHVKVKPILPYMGEPFRIKVSASTPVPEPDPTPDPTPFPPNPFPPGPTPGPTPTPVPPGELKVLFLQESEGPMTEKQLQVWHSGEVEDLLIKNTSPGSDGVPGYRKWDKDQDPSDDTPEWAEMLNAMKAELAKTNQPLPVVGIFRGGKGTIKPLPSTVQEMTQLIQK